MTDKRPVLIGMNNPLSSDPRYALAPYPQGVAGHRLYQMLQAQNGARRAQYMRVFDRRNVLSARVWDVNAARRESAGLKETLGGRKVCILGRDTLNALHLRGTVPPLQWNEYFTLGMEDKMTWCYVPHPSGLNLWYNDDLNWTAVGLRLEQLYEEYARL